MTDKRKKQLSKYGGIFGGTAGATIATGIGMELAGSELGHRLEDRYSRLQKNTVRSPGVKQSIRGQYPAQRLDRLMDARGVSWSARSQLRNFKDMENAGHALKYKGIPLGIAAAGSAALWSLYKHYKRPKQ